MCLAGKVPPGHVPNYLYVSHKMKLWHLYVILSIGFLAILLWIGVRYIEYRDIKLGQSIKSQNLDISDYKSVWIGEMKAYKKINGAYIILIITDIIPDNQSDPIFCKSFHIYAFGLSVVHTGELNN